MQDINKAVILCVEDEIDLRDDLVEELEEAGYEVVVADNGKQALELLDVLRPELILCDITMPDYDGYELLRILRDTRSELADIPFVFLTAQAGSEQIVRGKRAGADDYLVKPIDFDLMLATIESRMGQMSRVQKKLSEELDRIGKDFSEQQERKMHKVFENMTQTLDYVASGIVLLDIQGKVQFANRMAKQVVNRTRGANLSDLLGTSGVRHALALQRVVEAAIEAHRVGQEHVDCLSLPRASGLRDLLVIVCALGGDPLAPPGEPAVAVFISDTGYRPPAPVEILNTLFGLTPAESQIAWAFAEGKRADEIAVVFGISATTVAFHKRNLFQKTNTNRQADLIALLLSLALPVEQD